MGVKRFPQIKKEHAKRYWKLSKADIIEAYRDAFQELGGAGELDDDLWIDDLERRVKLLKFYRKHYERKS